MDRASSGKIEREAADWVARLDRGALSADENEQLDRWLSSDPRREGAFIRFRALSFHSERAAALGSGFDPANYSPPDVQAEVSLGDDGEVSPGPRRHWIWGAAAAAACLLLVFGAHLLNPGEVFETRLGEVRVIPLEDGSVVTLNTDSRIAVRFDDDRRSVTLLEGEALFDVASNKTRPFIVQARDTAVKAVGTSFSVRRLEGAPVEVIVREGLVEMTKASTSRPVRLAANMRAVSAAAKPALAGSIAPAAVSRELAWREGRLAFEAVTLAEAARQFSRYSRTRITVAPEVAGEEITGVFAANDPVSFGRAAALTLNIRATVGEDEVHLGR